MVVLEQQIEQLSAWIRNWTIKGLRAVQKLGLAFAVLFLGSCGIRRAGLVVITVVLTLIAGASATVDAQQVGFDIAIATGDQLLTDVREILAKPDETIVIEVFASDFAGEHGVEAVFQVSDPTAIVASSIATAGGTFFPQTLPASITGNELRVNWISIIAQADDGEGLQFIGRLTFTLSSTFTELDLFVTQVSVGNTPLEPNIELRATNQITAGPTIADADFDKNGIIDFTDFVTFVKAFGTSQDEFDLDSDGEVGFSDFIFFVSVFGKEVPLEIVTDKLPSGTPDQSYSHTLTARGGDGHYTWTLTEGSLPAGLSLSADGTVSGTPTSQGVRWFTVTVSSRDAVVEEDLSITIELSADDQFLAQFENASITAIPTADVQRIQDIAIERGIDDRRTILGGKYSTKELLRLLGVNIEQPVPPVPPPVPPVPPPVPPPPVPPPVPPPPVPPPPVPAPPVPAPPDKAPEVAPVASIEVSPSSAILDIGDTVALTATLRDASGNVLSGRSISWTSSDLSVANGTFLDEALAIDGLSAGAATITATSEGVSGSATITVLAPPPPPPFSLTCSTVAGGSIFADDGQYLGSLTNRFSSDSILNEFGSYGSSYSSTSIYNQYSSYGSSYSLSSAYSEFTTSPPVLYVNGVSVAYVTKSFMSPGVDPDALKACSW